MDVPSHCTFVGGVVGVERTGGLHNLENATLQQKQISLLKLDVPLSWFTDRVSCCTT